jgi:hypothetical protein
MRIEIAELENQDAYALHYGNARTPLAPSVDQRKIAGLANRK